ncbi:MAG: AMP-binding protein [Hyphomicrobiales bacterium]
MNSGVAANTAEDTLPKILLRNAEKFADRPSMREKNFGIWQTWTWADALDEIRALSVGFTVIGLKRGDKVAIVGDNRPRLYWAMVAAQAVGAVPVPVYQDSVAEEMGFVFDHAGVSFAVVENQEQVDKVLEISETYEGLNHIIYDEERGLQKYDKTQLHSFETIQELGRKALADGAGSAWLEEIGKGSGSDVAIMLYTSGTTGAPKGVVLSQDNIVISARNGNEFDSLNELEETVAYMPMAWVGDHIFSIGQAFCAGYCVNCPESPETAIDDRREIAPTYFFATPRVFETLLTVIMVQMEDAGKLKKKMFDYFMAHARNVGEPILNGESVAFTDKLLYWLGELLVYGPLKNRMGFTRLRVGYTAGEAIGPEIFRFYRSLGLNLKQLYGQTEASVYVTAQPDGEIRADTVGKPAPGVEIKIDEKSGEVLYRSPGVFQEYFKNPEATEETKTKDNWVRSGDAGIFDETGHLKIIDRAKDVGKLKDGTLFPPKYIENKLKFFPNVKEVVAFGHGRDNVTAFVNIDLTAVGSWAERHNVNYASYQELAANPDVYKMIENHVDEVNRELAHEPGLAGAQIKRFLILHKELDPDDGEITRTNKVRRSLVSDRYAPLVKALYDLKKNRQKIKTDVTFEDGRRGILEGDIEIRDMNLHADTNQREAAE